MKKPEKCRYGGFDYYDITEMDAYIAHLEQAVSEAREALFDISCGRNPMNQEAQAREWLSKYWVGENESTG